MKDKAKSSTQGLAVKKEENFSEWYNQLVQKAELADYSDVKGFMVIRPNAYSIWEAIQQYFDKKIKAMGVRNAYFPLLIPESFFKKEAEHAQGFTPEVAWIANKDENNSGKSERLAIRPTSETIMYDSYAKWIRSWRDLPLRINQWCNVVRWETKATRLFLRTREFLWQEGHCVYETKADCDKETEAVLREYKEMCEKLLAIPVLSGRKTEGEKFSGALYTLSVEGIMPDGRALQMGTSHNLGQGFAESFGISFLDRDGSKSTPWQNSWGVSTRLIGALTMVHGDDLGLVLPPRVAYNKLAIVPLLFKGQEKKVLAKAKEIEKKLARFAPILDNRDSSPGWKFHEWELKGMPLRIELGPRDLEKNQLVLVRRDTGKKEIIKISRVEKSVETALEDMQTSLLKKAEKSMKEKIVAVKDFSNLKKVISSQKVGFGFFCGNKACDEEIKGKADGAKTLNYPLNQKESKGKCIVCGKSCASQIYIAKSY